MESMGRRVLEAKSLVVRFHILASVGAAGY
jgi:hypothetical protein